MKEILDFLGASPAFYVGTTDQEGNPRVRPFSFVMEWDGKLTFVTATNKKIYKQLQNRPLVEICSFTPPGRWMRISGEVAFTNDIEAKKKVFEVMPALKAIYPEQENSAVLTCFYIVPGKGEVTTYGFDLATPQTAKF